MSPVRLTAGILLGSFASALVAAPPERFDPERHFPRDCFLYYNLNVGGLRAGCREVPLGRLLLHPGVQKALGRLPEMLLETMRGGTSEFREVVGRDPWEILDLLTGEVAMTIAGVDMLSGPRLLFAVDLGPRRKELLEIVSRVESFITSHGGDEAVRDTADVGGIEVTSWTPRFGPSVQYGVLGGSFVFAVGVTMDTVVERFTKDGEGAEDALRFNPAFARAKLQASGFTPAATFFVNWETIRTTINLFMGEVPMAQEVQKAFAAIGLDKLASGIYRTGFKGGDFETKIHLDSPGGLGGLLGLLAECVGPPEATAPPGGFPAGSEEAAAVSYSVGRLARGVVDAVSQIHPEAKAAVDGFLGSMERVTGIAAEDLFKLPKLTIYYASVRPASGGVVPDAVALVRTAQFEPYLVLLDRAGRKLGAQVTSVKAGERDIAYMVLSNYDEKLGFKPQGSPFAQVAVPPPGQVILEGGDEGAGEPVDISPPVFFGRPAGAAGEFVQLLQQMESHLTLAFAPLDDEWMVVATTPQAVSRHLAARSATTESSADAALTRLIDKEIGSGAAYSVMRGGRNFIAAYNTLVSIAVLTAPSFEKELKTFGVDLAHLPAGEEIAGAFGDGFLVIRSSKEGLTVHTHRLLTNLMGSSSLLSSLFIPMVAGGMKKSLQQGGGMAGPEERLKALGAALKAYAEGPGEGAYPFDRAGTLAALETVLADEGLGEVEKRQLLDLLVCPGSPEKPAAWRGEETEIAAGNVSYELVPWKQGPRDNPARLLAYEKRSQSGGDRLVLFVDLNVRELADEEFQVLLADQKRKYGKAAGDDEEAEEEDK